MFNKVLILSASAGAGHVRAAKALVDAFGQLDAAKEILHVDALEYMTAGVRDIYANAHIQMASRMPEVFRWMYRQLDKPWKKERGRLEFSKLFSKSLITLLKNQQPDIAVCTHFLPSEIISWLNVKQKISYPQAIVVTDMDAHAMWLCRHYQRYFVPIKETKIYLRELGVPADKISVSGIPIDPVFSILKSKYEMRLKHGLRPDRICILVSAGGTGEKATKAIVESLKLLEHPAQIVIMCGRNQELFDQIAKLASKAGNDHIDVKPVGFTTVMDEYMAAADLFIGKPGGMTISEAMSKELIMVIVNPYPGQEEHNADHLLEQGVAIKCNQLQTMAFKIDSLLNNGKQVERMRQNISAFARPDAALNIVRQLLKDREEGNPLLKNPIFHQRSDPRVESVRLMETSQAGC